MDSFLGSIRNASLVLLVVCATVLLFAFSPNDHNSLTKARDEATNLRYLAESSLVTVYELSLIDRLNREDTVYYKGVLQKAFAGFTDWDTTPMFVTVPILIPPPPTTLQDFQTYFTAKQAWGIVVPFAVAGRYLQLPQDYGLPQTFGLPERLSGMREAIDTANCIDVTTRKGVPCEDIVRMPGVTLSAFILRITAPQAKKALLMYTGGGSSTSLASPNIFSIWNTFHHDPIYDGFNDVWSGRLTIMWIKGSHKWSLTETASLLNCLRNDAAPSFVTWIQTQKAAYAEAGPSSQANQAAQLLAAGKSEALFTELRNQNWNNISLETPRDAEKYFEGRVDSSPTATISLFGLTVDQRVVLVAAPLAILVSALYLLSSIRMLIAGLDGLRPAGEQRRDESCGRVGSEAPEGRLQLYPWFGLYNDRLSVAGSLATMVVFPPLASAVATDLYWAGWRLATVASVAISALVLVVSFFMLAALKGLRQRFARARLALTSSGGTS